MYSSAAKLAFTSLLTSKLVGFNFVIHLTAISFAKRGKLFPGTCFDILLYYYYDHTLTSDLEKLFSNAQSCDEYLCQVSFKSIHYKYADVVSREITDNGWTDGRTDRQTNRQTTR